MASNHYFPFEALGFHSNPFRALTDEEWATIAILPPEICDALQQDTHIQILGDAGHGKSTTLRGLVSQLGQQGKKVEYEYLPLGQHHFITPPSIIQNLDVFLLDEVQRLNRRQRNKLFSIVTKHHVRLILGSHEDFEPRFSKNKLPITTIILDDIDPSFLGEMLTERLNYFRIGSNSPVYFEADAIDYLLDRFRRNLRLMEYYLYEVFQHLADAQKTEPISATILTEIDPLIVNLVEQE